MSSVVKIFLVEDDKDIRDSLSGYLRFNDFEVHAFSRAEDVLPAFIRDKPDLLILDVMLPYENGFSLARTLRAYSRVPLVFLTARESESDRITGFELGADDYVVKPFYMKEFVLRIKALLRRISSRHDGPDNTPSWILNGSVLKLDEITHQIHINDNEISLTISEWLILKFLISNETVVISREQILEDCLEYSCEGRKRIVDTHIKNIRAKIPDSDWIETIRGWGYRFNGVRKPYSPLL